MRKRHQEGRIFKRCGTWYLQVRRPEKQGDGTVERKQRAFKLVDVGPDYRSKRDLEELRREKLEELGVNSAHFKPESIQTLDAFVENHYLREYGKGLSPSNRSVTAYNWRKHLSPLLGHIPVRDFRAGDAQRAINELAERGALARETVVKLKNNLSAILAEAARQDLRDGNPIPDVVKVLPFHARKLRAPKKRYAYSLPEVLDILDVLGEPARTITIIAALTGLRMGEIQALTWESYRDGKLWVTQSYWRGHLTPCKTEASNAPVAVIPALAEAIEAHRIRTDRSEGWMFASRRGTPVNLDNLRRRNVRVALESCAKCRKLQKQHRGADHAFVDRGLPAWHGWHSLRHGVSTVLNEEGVDIKTIQAVLRHADPKVTEKVYLHATDQAISKAMGKLQDRWDDLCTKRAPSQPVSVS